MKRNRTIERVLKMHLWDPPFFVPADVIPPLSVVKLISGAVATKLNMDLGAEFRIGYYSKQDGPNVVWLVDRNGKYQETIDQKILRDGFTVLSRSNDINTYGHNRPLIGAL